MLAPAAPPKCPLCNGTGYEDFAGYALTPCPRCNPQEAGGAPPKDIMAAYNALPCNSDCGCKTCVAEFTRVPSFAGIPIVEDPTVPEGHMALLSLPDDDAKRQEYPMADGLLDYFPNALAEVSRVSKIGNDQHNPGQPMHWARDKSTDHANKILRHLTDRGRFDGRGVRHTARLAWRALAMLQTELEQEEGFPQSRASIGQAPRQAETVH